MHKVDFNKIDLNLLKLLDALLKERSVTRAGQRLGLSQPAASRALGRLRKLLNDRLVIRTATGLEPTPRAASLAMSVAKLLEDAQSIVAPTLFDPAATSRHFTIATFDHMSLLLLPPLLKKLAVLAPGLELTIPAQQSNSVDSVTQGEADLAIGVYENLPARFHCRSLYDDDLVCVVRSNHPVITAGLTLEHFIELPHLLVITTGQGQSIVDAALAKHDLSRRVIMRLPHFLAAPMLVAESDMVLSLPRRLAKRIAMWAPIEILELPLDTKHFTLSMIWHERNHDDPAHTWLRKQIVEREGK